MSREAKPPVPGWYQRAHVDLRGVRVGPVALVTDLALDAGRGRHLAERVERRRIADAQLGRVEAFDQVTALVRNCSRMPSMSNDAKSTMAR